MSLAATPASVSRFATLLCGLCGAVVVRVCIAAVSPGAAWTAAAVFAVILLALALRSGTRIARPPVHSLLVGAAGGALLLGAAAFLRQPGLHVWAAPRVDELPLWVALITVVAVAEELVLRGVLFDAWAALRGPRGAAVVTAIAFALMHVPLYGWRAVPLDLAAGLWLGGLRIVSGGVSAPAVAHLVADIGAAGIL